LPEKISLRLIGILRIKHASIKISSSHNYGVWFLHDYFLFDFGLTKLIKKAFHLHPIRVVEVVLLSHHEVLILFESALLYHRRVLVLDQQWCEWLVYLCLLYRVDLLYLDLLDPEKL
jgi:hypothetical protein